MGAAREVILRIPDTERATEDMADEMNPTAVRGRRESCQASDFI